MIYHSHFTDFMIYKNYIYFKTCTVSIKKSYICVYMTLNVLRHYF